jgi:peptide deformylase
MSNLIQSRKSRVSAVLATAAVSVGLVAAPAAQAQPVFTGGLVNVTLANNEILSNVGIGVAANVCGVNAAVLVQDLASDNTAECTSENAIEVTRNPRN